MEFLEVLGRSGLHSPVTFFNLYKPWATQIYIAFHRCDLRRSRRCKRKANRRSLAPRAWTWIPRSEYCTSMSSSLPLRCQLWKHLHVERHDLELHLLQMLLSGYFVLVFEGTRRFHVCTLRLSRASFSISAGGVSFKGFEAVGYAGWNIDTGFLQLRETTETAITDSAGTVGSMKICEKLTMNDRMEKWLVRALFSSPKLFLRQLVTRTIGGSTAAVLHFFCRCYADPFESFIDLVKANRDLSVVGLNTDLMDSSFYGGPTNQERTMLIWKRWWPRCWMRSCFARNYHSSIYAPVYPVNGTQPAKQLSHTRESCDTRGRLSISMNIS